MTRSTRKRTSQGRVLRLSSFMQKDAAAMHNLINRGPSTMVFVFSTTCPHCHTYLPIWKRMCQLKGRKANMISMEASTYNQTPMSQKNPVSGVPAVLHVDQNGVVTPVDNPRDKRVMTSYVRNTPPAFTQVRNTQSSMMPKPMQPPSQVMMPTPSQVMMPKPMQPSQYTSSPSSSPSRTYSSSETVTPSPLKPIPARGGNWTAMMAAAAQQAAPAAALLGAYAAFPMQRSSGLGPTRRTRRNR